MTPSVAGDGPRRASHREGADQREQAKRGEQAKQREKGSTAVELVLLTPVVIAMVFASVQGALLWHAKHLAVAAAQQGARVARSDTVVNPSASGLSGAALDQRVRDHTASYVRQLGGELLTDVTVTVQHTPGWVAVSVSGRAVGVLPGSSLRVQASSRTPLEAFR